MSRCFLKRTHAAVLSINDIIDIHMTSMHVFYVQLTIRIGGDGNMAIPHRKFRADASLLPPWLTPMLQSGTRSHLTVARLSSPAHSDESCYRPSNCSTSHTVNTLTSLCHYAPPIRLWHIGKMKKLIWLIDLASHLFFLTFPLQTAQEEQDGRATMTTESSINTCA